MSFSPPEVFAGELDNPVRPFYKDEYATIELDESIPCVKMTLNGLPRYSEHYHLVQAKRLELMNREIRNYPRLHMLTDSRTASPVLDQDVAHFKMFILPAMERAGIRCLAIVMPENKFTQLTIKEMTESASLIQIKYFESVRDAKLWLRKMTVS